MEVEPSSAWFHQWYTTKPLEVPWLHLKVKYGGSKWHGGIQAGLTTQEGRSDHVGHTASRSSEAEDMHRDRMACVEAKQGGVARLSI